MTDKLEGLNHPDLFLGESVIIDKVKKSHASGYMIWKQQVNYRKANSKKIRCKNCDHHESGRYHDVIRHKCELLGMSHSEATDVRVSFVCDKFKEVY